MSGTVSAGTFAGFSFRFQFLGDDPALVAEIARLLAGLRGEPRSGPLAEVAVRRTGDRLRLLIDGEQRFETSNAAVLVHHLIWEITRRAIASSGAALVAHAGAVRFGDDVVMVSGRSGAGKSTTVAALVAAGGTYLTDEAVALDGDGNIVGALARPMQLDARSHALLHIERDRSALVQPDRSSYVLPHQVGGIGAPVPADRVVVLALRGTDASLEVTAVPPSTLVSSLVREGFEPARRTQTGLDAAAALASGASTWSISGGTPRDRVDAMREILEIVRRKLVCGHPE